MSFLLLRAELTEVSTGSTLSCPVTNLHHKHHVVLIILDRLFEKSFDLFWKLSRVLMAKPSDVFPLKVKTDEEVTNSPILHLDISINKLVA